MAMFPTDPSSVSAAWLSEVLGADVRECRLEQIGIGVGLLGRLYRAHLKGGPDLPSSVVVKLPLLDARVRSEICEDLEFYLSEVRFYQEIGVANPLRPARPYFAAFDETTHDFVLVLEDLGRLRVADQIVGCAVADAETVIDGIARHHAYWWEKRPLRVASVVEDLRHSPVPCGFRSATSRPPGRPSIEGDRRRPVPGVACVRRAVPSLIPWFCQELTRSPRTFLHGDLRLDQLFFPVGADDPPLTVLDWQMTAKGRGAYDVGYFLSQSLDRDVRRGCEDQLMERYAERLAESGIDYPRRRIATRLSAHRRLVLHLSSGGCRSARRR